MRTPLLETKLYRPGPRPGLVPRPRLNAQLDRGAATKLDARLGTAPGSASPGCSRSGWQERLRRQTKGLLHGWRSTPATTTR